MKPINNWNDVKAVSERPKLPVGGYVCKIMGAEEKTYQGQNGAFSKLEVSIDIYEGDYNGFYADDYRAQNREDKKWGGVVRLYVPTDDGSDTDEYTKSIFKGFTDAVEDSNPNYHWDWDEEKLKGKIVGCLFRNEEWEFNGNSGWKVKPFKFVSADIIREEKFTMPKDKPLKNSNANTVNSSYGSYATSAPPAEQLQSLVDDDLPFN